MSEPMDTPQASVVIPTYNRSDKLSKTLETMTEQDIDPSSFEVIIADDGSSDDTVDVMKSFAGRLRLKYYFQADEGFRAGAARNGGARLAAAPILIFLDSGTLAGPGLVSGHLALHAASEERRAVIGYCYGYDAFRDELWVPEGFDTPHTSPLGDVPIVTSYPPPYATGVANVNAPSAVRVSASAPLS